MAGAKTIQMAAAPIIFGYEIFEETLEKMNAFLDHQHYKSVEEIVGISLKHLRKLEDVPRRDVFRPSAVVNPEECTACGRCTKVCFYGAIVHKKKEKAVIDPKECVGCGLCTQVCPKDAIRLVIKGSVVATSWEGARGRLAESKRKP
jgi:ferredoxin